MLVSLALSPSSAARDLAKFALMRQDYMIPLEGADWVRTKSHACFVCFVLFLFCVCVCLCVCVFPIVLEVLCADKWERTLAAYRLWFYLI